MVKNPPANAEDVGSILGQEDPLEEEMATMKYVGRAQSIHSISRVPLSSNLQQPELSPNLPFGVFMEASLASIKSAR